MTGNYNKLESRVKTVEDAVRLLTDLAIRADERMPGFDYALTNVSVKLEALTDAQLRLDEAQLRTEAALTRLTEAQAQSDQRLDALINIVREDRERRNGH